MLAAVFGLGGMLGALRRLVRRGRGMRLLRDGDGHREHGTGEEGGGQRQLAELAP